MTFKIHSVEFWFLNMYNIRTSQQDIAKFPDPTCVLLLYISQYFYISYAHNTLFFLLSTIIYLLEQSKILSVFYLCLLKFQCTSILPHIPPEEIHHFL